METARIAESLFGDKLYQRRAREALPMLVRQAQAGSTIPYGDLASELKMPLARNLNFVLGSVGQTMKDLSEQWNRPIPAIQCLVINKATGLPGSGVGWFVASKEDFKKLPRSQQRRIVQLELEQVFAFTRWSEVLEACELEPLVVHYQDVIARAANFRAGGESEDHRRLKKYVAENPHVIGLPSNLTGEMEYRLPSGDSVDVHFRQRKKEWVAVEVKSQISPEADIVRGMFQCVKYRAVIEAYQGTMEFPRGAHSILALEGELPSWLVRLKNELRVEVVDRIKPA